MYVSRSDLSALPTSHSSFAQKTKDEDIMRKIIVSEFVTLDGMMKRRVASRDIRTRAG